MQRTFDSANAFDASQNRMAVEGIVNAIVIPVMVALVAHCVAKGRQLREFLRHVHAHSTNNEITMRRLNHIQFKNRELLQYSFVKITHEKEYLKSLRQIKFAL
jgi:hypothetical protein